LGVGLFFLITKIILPLIKEQKEGKKTGQTTGEKITLKYWGLWESEEVINPLITEYQKTHPNISVSYSQQSYKDYRERLQSALARSEGPDIFRFHHTWLPMLKKELASAPSAVAKEIGLEKNYFPIISESLKADNKVFGVPLGFDALVLFYNPEILKEAGKTFPTTWDELRRTAADLTVYDESEKIQTAGAALGTANNVEHFSDILGLMMLQNGVKFTELDDPLAQGALEYYSFFSLEDKVWDQTLPPSIHAFATEKVALIIAPSWRAHEIKQINPQLEFKTAPAPQVADSQVSWASFWAEGVSKTSKNSQAAWEFLQYLSSKESLIKFYTQASELRDFGEPYPRQDLADQLENDPIVGAVVKQGPYAQSWYLCSDTHDNGINDKMIKYFEDAVNQVVGGESPAKALAPATQGVVQVLNQYGIK